MNTFVHAGPVAEAFLSSRETVQAINGPVGGGKTTALFHKASRIMPLLQPRSPVDGVRRRVVTVVHANYRRLWANCLPTWWEIWPREVGEFQGGSDSPATHFIRWRHPLDDGHIEIFFRFLAIGDNLAEDVMRGYETTDWLLMEADLLDEEVYKFALTRLGRAPPRRHGDNFRPYIGIDFNAPEFDSWVYRYMMDEWEEGKALYRQPPAAFETSRGAFTANPNAENLQNLPTGYYQKQIDFLKKQDPDLVRRMVCNRPGLSKVGIAVYAEDYDDLHHVAVHGLEPEPGLPLFIGMDAGGDPCAILFQIMGDGQARILQEMLSVHGTGPTRFAENLNRLLGSPRFHAFDRKNTFAWADPSAFYGGDAESDSLNDQDWATKVMAVTKLRIRPAHLSNALHPRLQAVRDKLRMPLGGGAPGLLLDPNHCSMLRKGFMNGYLYREVKGAGGSGTSSPYLPAKNEFSHIHDALQYGLQGAEKQPNIGEDETQIQLAARSRRNPRGRWGTAGSRMPRRRA